MRQLWFRRKRYGWGWYPATAEGWLVTFLGVLALIGNALIFMQTVYAGRPAVVVFAILEILIVSGLIIICYLTGERPRWQWGKRSDD